MKTIGEKSVTIFLLVLQAITITILAYMLRQNQPPTPVAATNPKQLNRLDSFYLRQSQYRADISKLRTEYINRDWERPYLDFSPDPEPPIKIMQRPNGQPEYWVYVSAYDTWLRVEEEVLRRHPNYNQLLKSAKRPLKICSH